MTVQTDSSSCITTALYQLHLSCQPAIHPRDVSGTESCLPVWPGQLGPSSSTPPWDQGWAHGSSGFMGSNPSTSVGDAKKEISLAAEDIRET